MTFNLDIKMDFIPKCYSDGINHIKFEPPIYVQRYCFTVKILKHPAFSGQIKKVVDFGCAELKFFYSIKHNVSEVEHVICVDIDEDLLRSNAEKTKPLLIDYLKRRPCPLVVEVYKGSATSRCECLQNTDAVVAIELIEHLHSNVLEDIPANVFGFMKPKMAIFTTPNSDINCIFPDLINGGFRHWDHKFEWTRKEFEDWAHNICERYPKYSVQFYGVGAGPEDLDNLGCISQLALFLRSDMVKLVEDWNKEQESKKGQESPQPGTSTERNDSPSILPFFNLDDGDDDEYCPAKVPVFDDVAEEPESDLEIKSDDGSEDSIYLDYFSPEPSESDNSGYGSDEEYKLILKAEYPFNLDERSPSQKILDDAKFHIMRLEQYRERFYNEEEDVYRIPIEVIHNLLGEERTTFAELKKLLSEDGYTIIENDVLEIHPELQHFSDSADDGCESDHSGTESPVPQPRATVAVTQDDLWEDLWEEDP